MINWLWLSYRTINKAYLGFSIQKDENCSTLSVVILLSEVLNNKWHPRVINIRQIIRTRGILPWLKSWNKGTRSTLNHILLQSSNKDKCNWNQDSIKNKCNCNQDTQFQPQSMRKQSRIDFQKPNFSIIKDQVRNSLIKQWIKNQSKILAIEETITKFTN